MVSCFDLSFVDITDVRFLDHGLDWFFLLDLLGGHSAWNLLRSTLPLLLLHALLLEFFLLLPLELSYFFDIASKCVVIRVKSMKGLSVIPICDGTSKAYQIQNT
jgi:hypothetical protein